ncbi:hypothetical protein JW926_05890 [Candidatus Sumerlaeota bacterium]|nr:hypothetical protein [Candidatus Sumerlaeota bacterium]
MKELSFFSKFGGCGKFFALGSILFLSLALSAFAESYNQVTIAEGFEKSGVGRETALAIQPHNGFPAIAAVTTEGEITLFIYDGALWNYEVVAETDDLIYDISLVYDPTTNEPTIVYITSSFDSGIFVAMKSGNSWIHENFAISWDHPFFCMKALIIPGSGKLGIAFSGSNDPSSSSPKIHFAERNAPGSYSIVKVDGGQYDIAGQYLDAAVNPDTGEIGLTYDFNGDLRFARRTGSSWFTETVISYCSSGSITYALKGGSKIPHITGGYGTVYTKDTGSWVGESVDTDCYLRDIATDPLSDRAIAFYIKSDHFMLSRYDGVSWTPETMGPSKTNSSIDFSPSGTAYGSMVEILDGTNGTLEAFTYAPGSYTTTMVRDWANPGFYPSAGFAPNASADFWLAYQDQAKKHPILTHLEEGEFPKTILDTSENSGYDTSLFFPDGSAKPWVLFQRTDGLVLSIPGESGYSEEIIPGSSGYSCPKVAVDPLSGEICIVFRYISQVWFARRTAPNTWESEAVSLLTPSGSPAISFDPQTGYPRVLFIKGTFPSQLIELQYDGSTWNSSILDASGDQESYMFPTLEIDAFTSRTLAAYGKTSSLGSGNYITEALYRAHNGSSWSSPEIVDSILLDAHTAPVLLMDPVNNIPWIFFGFASNEMGDSVRLAKRERGSWNVEILRDEIDLDYNSPLVAGAISPNGEGAFAARDRQTHCLLGWLPDSLLGISKVRASWNLYE